MTITVLKLSDADAYLKNISIKTIKDVRALDVDLMLILMNGDRIIINNGAVSAMSAPESSLQFADGKLPLASVFQQIDKIDVSPEANLTVSSKEITRYNQNNAKNKKARKDEEEDGDKPVVVDPNSSGDAVDAAQRTLDALQNLPTGTTVADYLISNHVAIPNPVITIRNAVVGNAKPWQTAPFNETLVLDQGDFLDGDLRVKTTPNAKVQVIINGRDVLGRELSITLPAAHADGEGSAILHADTESMDLLYTLDREHSVIAQMDHAQGQSEPDHAGRYQGRHRQGGPQAAPHRCGRQLQ